MPLLLKKLRPANSENLHPSSSSYSVHYDSSIDDESSFSEECNSGTSTLCRYCVFSGLGSTPQGRKCVTCIAKNKISRMLKHLSDSEVKQIMSAEMGCETNQIPPEKIFVNAEPLDWDQLMLLLSCPNPPKGLKLGCYWYDKASGFLGKEGQRPSQIISPQLDIGCHLLRNASGGRTNVTVNGRVVTKEELLMLKVSLC